MEETVLNMEMTGKCSVCKEDLTMFGSKELKNGVLCRNCAKKVSSWITDEELKLKSINGIKIHLRNREKNMEKLAGFNPDTTVEGKYTLYIDKEKKAFAVSKKSDFRADNADVIPARIVKSIELKCLPYEDTENLDVYLIADVRNRMFDKVCYRVNEFPGLEKDSVELNDALMLGKSYIKALVDTGLVNSKRVKED